MFTKREESGGLTIETQWTFKRQCRSKDNYFTTK